MKAVLRPAIGVEVLLKNGLPSHVGSFPMATAGGRWITAYLKKMEMRMHRPRLADIRPL